MKSSWYVATLVVRSVVAGETSGPWTYDEQIRVLRATSDEDAYEKALQLGKAEEQTYENMYGRIVTWQFAGLVDLGALSDGSIKDGTEIKGRYFESEDSLPGVQVKDQLTVFRWEQERQQRKSGQAREVTDR